MNNEGSFQRHANYVPQYLPAPVTTPNGARPIDDTPWRPQNALKVDAERWRASAHPLQNLTHETDPDTIVRPLPSPSPGRGQNH